MKALILMIVLTSLSIPFSISAQNVWYTGKVDQLIASGPDGSFYVLLDNQAVIDNCAYKRVIFRVSDMGVERTKVALSMAMAALMSGKKWGVVIDMPAAGSVCYASATSAQGATIYSH